MNAQLESLQEEVAQLRLQVKLLAKLMYECKKHGTMMVELVEYINKEEGEQTLKELEAVWKE